MHRLTQHTDDPAEQVPLDLREDQRVAIKATVMKAQQSLAILPFLLEQSTVPRRGWRWKQPNLSWPL
uniref:Uncharacterized protein n=2 Tax=Pseudomonas TaxID=286 RepID=A0A7G8AC34_PSEAI|nr:Hypothetical protein [Pseudomonas putida]QNI15605.1 Hypothetical protein [Pseudomonas aeruginosa]QNI16555.1 Hypothetical protein [Pseudomonas aeruginosa]QNI17048.1 Hypothetical protein [Pseudomonas sp.]